MDWAKYDKSVDLVGLSADVEDAEVNGKKEYKEVPVGSYEVKIEKLELKESKNNQPMVSCWMKILNGEYKDNLLFYNQVINSGFGIKLAKDFLYNLGSECDIVFESYQQFDGLILDVFEDISKSALEYGVKYSKNEKGYAVFDITDVFDPNEDLPF